MVSQMKNFLFVSFSPTSPRIQAAFAPPPYPEPSQLHSPDPPGYFKPWAQLSFYTKPHIAFQENISHDWLPPAAALSTKTAMSYMELFTLNSIKIT